MATRIHIPGVVDVLLVADPSEIRTLDDEPHVDRRFVSRGPLINRLIVDRIRRWFEIDGQLLPSLTPRGDETRAARQRELSAALDPASGRALWSESQLKRLVAYVRGQGSSDDVAITVQETVGRLFDPAYRADATTWRAAALIDRFRDGFSPIQIVWQITGRLRKAFELLHERCKRDRWTMHATAIGVHGIVHALERMRLLRAQPDAPSLSDDAVIARSLAPPKQVPRTVEAAFTGPAGAGRLQPGTLVMLQLEQAMPRAPDSEMIFMRDHWNACPAQTFIRALLLAVWHHSLHEKAAAAATTTSRESVP